MKRDKIANQQWKVHNSSINVMPWYEDEYVEKDGQFIVSEIDRIQESKDVDEFQRTKNEDLFVKIYERRIPTLRNWARQFHFLENNDDMMGIFNHCFYKAVMTFDINKKTFNTYLFYCLMNCVRNLRTEKKAKKRLPEGVDPNLAGHFLLSLDYDYGDDGSSGNLKSKLSESMEQRSFAMDSIKLNDTARVLSNNNPIVFNFLKDLSKGHSVSALIKIYKTKNGIIKLNTNDYQRFSQKHIKSKDVSAFIGSSENIIGSFSLVRYSIVDHQMRYTIEMKKTKDTDVIIKSLRRLRKDRKNIMARIE